MRKSNIKVEEFIRVDHAGERGAVKIYEGQLLALNTIIKDENLKKNLKIQGVSEKTAKKHYFLYPLYNTFIVSKREFLLHI